MPPPRKKAKLETMRRPKNPVGFEQFKKLIENLPDISFEVQRDGVAGKGVLTLDECAFWYYESFYRNPEVRQKYPYKLRACPSKIRAKLLSMPESEPVNEPVADHLIDMGVMVKVARMGTFIFPVTFFAFKNYVNAEKVFRMMGMTKEERKAILADENQCEVILKKFYNSFYMFPDRQSTDIFKNISPQFLEVLLKHGEPYDELAKKSFEKHAAGKKRQPAVVSFEVFEKYLANMYDIVCQLKLHDRDYAALDFEECARALYLAFYVKPEIRDRYTFKWRPSSLAMQKRLLNIPNEESAAELRKSFPQLIPDSSNEEEKETVDVDTESPVLVIDEPISAANDLRTLENNNNNSFEKQLNQPVKENSLPRERDHVTISEELPKLVLEESSEELQEELFQTDVEVDIGISGRFMFPVSFDTFRRCINYGEIIRPILALALEDTSQIENLIPHPHNPICEKIFLRYYRSFYIFPDTRQKYQYRFSCRNDRVLKKLTEYAKPLNETARKTMDDPKPECQKNSNAVPAEQRRNNQAEENDIATVSAQEGHQKMENIENTKGKEISENIESGPKKKPKKLPKLPVTFHVFKRYVTNLNQILQQMKLCDEYKEKSDTECAEEYYKGFYTSPEMRNKFECILKPCPAKMRDVLLSYAKQPEWVDSSQESVCVCPNDSLPSATDVATLSEKSKASPVKESKVEETHENHVSFQLFKRYISNLNEIVQQMLLCDEYRGKSEEACARDYYNGFYSSQEVRDRFPYQLKPCPAKTRDKLISFPTKDQRMQDDPSHEKLKENIPIQNDEVEVNSSGIPAQTEKSLLQNQTSNNSQQTAAPLGQKSEKTSSNIRKQKTVRTFKNGASFEFPVSFETFKRHINYDEIVKSLLLEYVQNETEQSNRGKTLFRNFFCSFYVQKDVRQRYPYRFLEADKELLKKLEEYAVPLNDIARQTMSDQVQGKAPQNEKYEDKSEFDPRAPQDETLITISGIAYRFPVTFKTFHKYINYKELKEGLANCVDLKQKSPEQLAEILGDEKSCLRLLRSYYHSFYTTKNVRNKMKYNFNTAPPELSDNLLEWAKPVDESAEPAPTLSQAQPQVQPKQGSSTAPDPSPGQDMEDVSPDSSCSSSDKSRENILITEELQEELFQTDVEVEIGKSGRFIFPVSFDTFRRCINYGEIIRPILGLALEDKFQIENLIPHPHNPICEKIFLRYYRSFYIFPDTRQKYQYRFTCRNDRVLKKLTEYAKPLNESARKTMDDPKPECQKATNAVPAEQSRNNQTEEADIATVSPQEAHKRMENIENTKDKDIEENIESGPKEKAKKLPKLPVTFHVFKRYVTNLNQILQQMKLCDEYKEKSDTECAEEYYKGFYTSPEMRNKFECILKPCPAKMRDVLLSYAKQPEHSDKLLEWAKPIDKSAEPAPTLSQAQPQVQPKPGSSTAPDHGPGQDMEDVSLEQSSSNKLPVQTEEFLPQNQTSNNSQQTVATLNQKSRNTSSSISKQKTVRTFKNGASFEFPVSFETFKRHINYDEIVKSLLLEYVQNETEQSNRGKTLFRNFFCSFYVQKDVRQRYPYRFLEADKELLKKLEEYAVPLNDIARQTMSDQAQGKAPQNEKYEDKSGMDPRAPQDETLITISGIAYRFPVTFKTFHKYINYKELKEGLANCVDLKQKSPEQLAEILGDEKSCLRLLRSYYHSFYTAKNVRNKLKYTFITASPELSDKLLEWAKPVDESTEPAQSLSQTLPQVQPKPGAPNGATHGPIEAPVTDDSIRDKLKLHPCSAETREGLSDQTYNLGNRDPDDMDATKEKELEGKPKIHCFTYRPRSLRQYLACHISVPEKQALLEQHILDSTTTKENKTVSGQKEATMREETATRGEDLATRVDDTSTREKDNDTREGTTREEAAAREPTTSEGGKTTASKEAITTRKEETTRKKNTEAKSTNKSPPVPNKERESNSAKQNELQKSSELASVSENISKSNSKENHKESATTKPTEEATRNVSLSDSTRKSESLNVSHRQTERQLILDQAKKVFFEKRSQDHNMAYLICTSQGLKSAIWRILYQLTLEEFKTYTSIHNGEVLYRKDMDLQPYYQHVVDKGNWPINLYVRLPLLRQLLHSKGVELGRLDLGQLSPKILHWREADEHTNFDQIVERQFKDRTDEEIDSVEQWFEERERFYAACWLHDQWIYEVPQITNDALHDESYIKDLSLPDLNGIVLKSLPIARSENVSSQTEIISIASSSDMVPDSQSCPSTQLSTISNFLNITTMQSSSALHDESCIPDLTNPNGIVFFSSESLSNAEREDGSSQTENVSKASQSSDMVPDSQICPPTQLNHTSNFVDIASVDIQSQVPETPLDPLAPQAETVSSVKQEPIKFLNNLRGICDTNGCQWEHIGTEEQIVDLDSSQEEGPSLSCFAIQKPSDAISRYQSLDSLVNAPIFEDDNSIVVVEHPQANESDNIEGMPKHSLLEEQHEETAARPAPSPKAPEVNLIQQAEEAAVRTGSCPKAAGVHVIQSQVQTLPKLAETRKKKIPASNTVPSKRARLVNDKVPQLRHEFRPLPLGACVRTETEVLGTDKTPTEPPQIMPTPQPEEVPTTNMTPSQEFAQGNTLLESTQLAALLDALPPGIIVRKVNEKEQVNGNLAKVTVSEPRLGQRGIFRKLERFNFFASLTVQHIIKLSIDGYLPGATYQSAMLKIDGKISHVRGSLLNNLFPHLSPQLRSDLERVLRDLPEFVYSCRWRRVHKDSTEDLRKRVLFTFMDVAPGFGQFRLQFDNAWREWATYSEIGRCDASERTEPRPRSLEQVISPGILDRMRELKIPDPRYRS